MTTGEQVKKDLDKAVHSEDQPMEKQSPSAPFAMVGLSYLIVLILALVGIGLIIWFMQ